MADGEQGMIARCKEGDIAAFEELFENYGQRAYRIAYRMIRNHEDAKDISQEAFLRAFKSMGRFDPRFNFGTWLYRITVNLCVDWIRRRSRREISFQESGAWEEIPDGSPAPDKLSERRELHSLIREAIESLPRKEKVVVVLRDVEGFSYREIARILNCAQGTVMSRLYYGRKKVGERMKGYLKDDR